MCVQGDNFTYRVEAPSRSDYCVIVQCGSHDGLVILDLEDVGL